MDNGGVNRSVMLLRAKEPFNTQPPKKMSEILMGFAWSYTIKGLTDPRIRQSYMNVACSAWNMSFLPENELPLVIAKFIDDSTAECDYADYESDRQAVENDLCTLIQLKKQKFSEVRNYILDIELQNEGDVVECKATFRDYEELMREVKQNKRGQQ